MNSSITTWRIAPVAWAPIALAIAAESVSNALRAYGLGMHLDRFTFQYQGVTVSLAGAVLVLAAVAVSLSQTRAAWVTLTPGRPLRQRLVAGIAAALLLAISITAMASHILEAQRAKVADEGGARGRYDRTKAAYDKAKSEYDALGNPRAVSVIQAEVKTAVTDWTAWRRSNECSDVTRPDTAKACQPILALYKERGAAARKAELEPELADLRTQLAGLTRPEELSASETMVSGWWAWIMGLGVVFIATFGTVIFATESKVVRKAAVEAAVPAAITEREEPFTEDEIKDLQSVILSEADCLEDIRREVAAGRHHGVLAYAERWSLSPSEASKRIAAFETVGEVSCSRVGKYKHVTAIARKLAVAA